VLIISKFQPEKRYKTASYDEINRSFRINFFIVNALMLLMICLNFIHPDVFNKTVVAAATAFDGLFFFACRLASMAAEDL